MITAIYAIAEFRELRDLGPLVAAAPTRSRSASNLGASAAKTSRTLRLSCPGERRSDAIPQRQLDEFVFIRQFAVASFGQNSGLRREWLWRAPRHSDFD